MNLEQLQKLQNKLFIDDIMEEGGHEQNFLYFLSNHPRLFQETITQGQLTTAEMNYIIQHFHDYKVDARTFENEFKRELKEDLPRYNMLKSIELRDELFTMVEDSYTRQIISERTTELAQTGNNTRNGSTNTNNDVKSANRQLPMQTSGTNTIDNLVKWGDGASGIGEDKSTGSSTVNQTDVRSLSSNGSDDGESNETFTRNGDPVKHIDRIWNYIVKPKAINWLTGQLSTCFILCI